MFLSESIQNKWQFVLDHPDLPKIQIIIKEQSLQLYWRTKRSR